MLKRSVCSGCLRPESVCLCDAMHSTSSRVQLIILQDPTEAKHKLSTVPLLKLSITNSILMVGEIFSKEAVLGDCSLDKVAVLYPFKNKPSLEKEHYPIISRLIVLDGTWRKVRKMLLNNPWLYELSHLTLSLNDVSKYRIRTSPRADGVSTIEAVISALNMLEDTNRFSICLDALELMVFHQENFGHKK